MIHRIDLPTGFHIAARLFQSGSGSLAVDIVLFAGRTFLCDLDEARWSPSEGRLVLRDEDSRRAISQHGARVDDVLEELARAFGLAASEGRAS